MPAITGRGRGGRSSELESVLGLADWLGLAGCEAAWGDWSWVTWPLALTGWGPEECGLRLLRLS